MERGALDSERGDPGDRLCGAAFDGLSVMASDRRWATGEGRPLREDGLMAVPVKAGSHAIDVQWTATRDVVTGREISAIALLALAVVAMRERKSGRGHRRV
jgi:hypothetical protein